MITLIRFCMVILIGLSMPQSASAGAPVCNTSSGAPYCQYSGKVKKLYVNYANTMLLYFDTSMDINEPANVGITGVTSGAAAAYLLTDNIDFGKLLYASLLAAQSRGAVITVQMRGSHGGYLKIDRIWVNE